jgi:hypothetical protein
VKPVDMGATDCSAASIAAAHLNRQPDERHPSREQRARFRESTVTDIVVARVAHVLAVVLWIGGVGMVTTVPLPAIRRSYPAEQRFGIFHAMEASFARQARVTTVITGISGFYMTCRLDARSRFQTSDFWWMQRRAEAAPEATYRRIEWLHRCLLVLSLATIAGAVVGSMGVKLFDL